MRLCETLPRAFRSLRWNMCKPRARGVRPGYGVALILMGVLSLYLTGAGFISCRSDTELNNCPFSRGRRILQDPGASIVKQDEGTSFSYKTAVHPTADFYQVNDEDIFLYSAFLDRRYSHTYIRVFGMQSRFVTSHMSCDVTHNDGRGSAMLPDVEHAIYPDWPSNKLKYFAYYYGYTLPNSMNNFSNLSLSVRVGEAGRKTEIPLVVEDSGEDSTSNTQGDLVVCVKSIWGSVSASRLIEWLEMNLILGVQKFVFYDTLVTGAARRVLSHYEARGLVEVIPFTFALQVARIMRNDPFKDKLSSEDMMMEQVYLVAMNDCYHRNRDSFRYVMVIDIDEVIVPSEGNSLLLLIDKAEGEYPNATAFTFQTAWHFAKFGQVTNTETLSAPFLHMQRHLTRTPVTTSQPKSIINSQRAININWHCAITMPQGYGYSGNQQLPWQQYGFVHHFRDTCKSRSSRCAEWMAQAEQDDVIPRFRSSVQSAVESTLESLDMLSGGS